MWWTLENESFLIACEKNIYTCTVVWGSADQAQFWHLLCQTLKHAKKTVIFIVLNYFWFFLGAQLNSLQCC